MTTRKIVGDPVTTHVTPVAALSIAPMGVTTPCNRVQLFRSAQLFNAHATARGYGFGKPLSVAMGKSL